MHIFRRALAILALVAALLLSLHPWVVSDSAFLANTIENNKHQNAKFERAALQVDDFCEQNKRLPSKLEIRAISTNFSFEIKSNIATISNADEIVTKELKGMWSPPSSAKCPYLLVDWGPDIPYFWSSWNRTSNAYTDPARFYTFGTRTADLLVFGLGIFLLICAAFLLWRIPEAN
jgi:hypothetical protein